MATAAAETAQTKGSGGRIGLAVTLGLLGGTVAVLGRPLSEDDYSESEVHKYDNEILPAQFIYRARDRVADFYKYFADPAHETLLPTMPPEYQLPYTLCIEYDKVLIKQEWSPQTGWRVKVRKGAREFLNYLCQFYELVIFTHSSFMTAQPILDELDKYGAVTFRLYRESTRFQNNVHVKDLNNLNRELRRVVMLDTDAKHCELNPDNCLVIPEWDGNPDDTTLIDLVSFFQILATTGVDDVRPIVDYYKGKDLVKTFKENQAALREAELRAAQEEQERQAKKGFRLFGKAPAPAGVDPQREAELRAQILREEEELRKKAVEEEVRKKVEAEMSAPAKSWWQKLTS